MDGATHTHIEVTQERLTAHHRWFANLQDVARKGFAFFLIVFGLLALFAAVFVYLFERDRSIAWWGALVLLLVAVCLLYLGYTLLCMKSEFEDFITKVEGVFTHKSSSGAASGMPSGEEYYVGSLRVFMPLGLGDLVYEHHGKKVSVDVMVPIQDTPPSCFRMERHGLVVRFNDQVDIDRAFAQHGRFFYLAHNFAFLCAVAVAMCLCVAFVWYVAIPVSLASNYGSFGVVLSVLCVLVVAVGLIALTSVAVARAFKARYGMSYLDMLR